ncbi:UDP-glycosyltransferase 83A1 [Rosa chinensis]|uniref:UDP-glycosyltransferase 83A1 n=1 Tax=Rosa chinensis TaxID=74649 RepID=UPI001AD947F6|nr:UDP-glycosyltransferase 83A1 [Rosa chinensis]
MNAVADETHRGDDQLHLVSIPDGLEPWEDRNELGQLCEAIYRVMPGKLEELIEKINGGEGDKITCVIADFSIGWALEVAGKMNIKSVAFFPAAAAVLALNFSIPQLIQEGIINSDGTVSKGQVIHLAPNMPIMKIEDMPWLCFDKNKSGIIPKGEIKNKVEQLLGDENYRARASKLKEMAMTNVEEGGQSNKIFKNLIEWIKS